MLNLKWTDFHRVRNLFLIGIDNSISKHQKIQDKKLRKLCSNCAGKVTPDPKKVIYNLSNHALADAENFVLCKGLQSALPPKDIDYADYIVAFETFRNIKSIDLGTFQNDSIKSKVLDTAYSSFSFYKRKKPKTNLSKAELNALKSFSQNKDLIIQKSDKGNTYSLLTKILTKIK